MQLLDVLTINEELKDKEDLLASYLKIKSREKVYGAFVFDNLMGKVREMKDMLKNENLLLAVTHDPVIAIYHRFE